MGGGSRPTTAVSRKDVLGVNSEAYHCLIHACALLRGSAEKNKRSIAPPGVPYVI